MITKTNRISFQGDYGLAESYLREALAVAEADGDDEARAMILNWLGTNAYGGGDLHARGAMVGFHDIGLGLRVAQEAAGQGEDPGQGQ